MAIPHIFFHKPWEDEFETNNAILNITPYKPEVMFIGTFNPATLNNNPEFFYGRNYFWTGFKNLFIHNDTIIFQRRNHTNPRNPTIDEILELCKELKLTFADLILGVLHNDNPVYEELPRNKVSYLGNDISLIADNGLNQLNGFGQISWNTQNIINYLCDNPSIKTIYFTRQPTGIWAAQWNAIVNHPCMEGRSLTNVFTPSGRTLPAPVMANLLNRWVHNGIQGFGQLDNNWLQANGVTLNNF